MITTIEFYNKWIGMSMLSSIPLSMMENGEQLDFYSGDKLIGSVSKDFFKESTVKEIMGAIGVEER